MNEELDLSVFDDRDERESTGECRICETNLYGYEACGRCEGTGSNLGLRCYVCLGDGFVVVDEPDDLCFQCWVRRDKAEAEYIAAFTHGGTR